MRRFIDWVYLSQQWTLVEVVRAKANKSHSDKRVVTDKTVSIQQTREVLLSQIVFAVWLFSVPQWWIGGYLLLDFDSGRGEVGGRWHAGVALGFSRPLIPGCYSLRLE